MTPDVLAVRDLTVRYDGRTVLAVDRLSVARGEILSMVGPNGAGKSTLLRILAVLERPASGTAYFDGQPIQYDSASLLALRRRMATVFQTPLLCNATVAANIAMGLRFRGHSAAAIVDRVRRWAETFGIAGLLSRPARTLSGGEAQRTSLARAFVVDPEVLFLDEPFSALDAPTRETLFEDLESVLRESRVTTVFVTHDRHEALRLGDRVAVIMRGELVQLDAPARVFASPVSEEVARFVGVDNLVEGVIRAQAEGIAVVEVEATEIEVATSLPPGQRVVVCLRADDLELGRPDAPPESARGRNVLRGKVLRVVPRGSQVRVHVDAGIPLTALVTKRRSEELQLSARGEVQIAFGVSAAHVIARSSAD